jgi:hypothetical protein
MEVLKNKNESKGLVGLIPLLFIVGVYFPSSINTIILPILEFLIYIPLFLVLLYFLLRQKVFNKDFLLLAFIINASLLLFSFTSADLFDKRSYGIYPAYFIYSLIILINFKKIGYSKYLKTSLLLVSFFQIVLGAGLLIKDITIEDFILDNYSYGYPTLVPYMLQQLKPVTTFATHSVSAFFFFILFILNFYTYKQNNKFIYLLFSIFFIILLLFTRSNTAYMYTFVSLLFLLVYLSKSPVSLFWFLTFSGAIAIYGYYEYFEVVNVLISYDLAETTGSQGSGILGRYSSSSANYLAPTIQFIKDHPFTPIGLSYSDNIFFTDSGPIIYFIRGSIFLVLAMYLGLYLFLRNNILNKQISFFLFVVFMLFETGMPNLIYTRSLYLLIFVGVYFNYLSDNEVSNDKG